MIRMIFLLTFALISFLSSGQESDLIEFYPSTCDSEEDVMRIRERISEIYEVGDSLFITVGFVANCAFDNSPMKVDANYIGDTLCLTFDFEYEVGDTIVENGDTMVYMSFNAASCDCCFEFQYVVKNEYSDSTPVKLNGKLIIYHTEKYKTYPVEYELLKGDTINLVDKYGFRQGKWLYYDKENRLINDRIYMNDSIVYGVDYRYYDDGVISRKLEWKDNEHLNYYEYDRTGNLTVQKKSPFDE